MNEKEFEKLRDEWNYCRKIVEELTKIQNRDTCPHCQQKMPPKTEIVVKIVNAQNRVNTLAKMLAPEIDERVKQQRAAAEQHAREMRDLKYAAEHMFLTRKNDFARVLRACKNGNDIKLPVLSPSEKRIWNEAMVQYIDRSDTYRDFEDEEELIFKIEIHPL
jgi:hypothetical protein